MKEREFIQRVWVKSAMPFPIAVLLGAILAFSFPAASWSMEDHAPSDNQAHVGQPAPNFTVATLDGKEISSADYRGKVLVVNFWATWCGACRIEMPWLAQLREQYAAQGFEVLGIVTDDAPLEKIAALTRRYGVKYPILMCNHSTAQAYGGLPDLPESFFVDRHGRVVAEMSAADSKREIETNVQKALRFGAR